MTAIPQDQCPLHDRDGRVFIVQNIFTDELEVLSEAPKWDLAENNQICFVANINGGDSVVWDGKEGL